MINVEELKKAVELVGKLQEKGYDLDDVKDLLDKNNPERPYAHVTEVGNKEFARGCIYVLNDDISEYAEAVKKGFIEKELLCPECSCVLESEENYCPHCGKSLSFPYGKYYYNSNTGIIMIDDLVKTVGNEAAADILGKYVDDPDFYISLLDE